MNEKKAYLILENGEIFEGKSFGYEKEAVGEVVFTTSVVGYLETLTDPGYYGQIVVQTFPLIGNYGRISEDLVNEKVSLNAYIVREWCHNPSNFRSEGDIDTFLKENKIPGLYGIDTRKLTKIIRENGVMKGKLAYSTDDMEKTAEELKNYSITGAVEDTTPSEITVYEAEAEEYRVVLWNFGARADLRNSMLKAGITVIDVPAQTTAEKIMGFSPDAVLLSDGPGNPADNKEIIKEVKKMLDRRIPMSGVCMGHQLMALAQGAETAMLKYGHRGSSQPVLDRKLDRILITGQNHGYYVKSESLPANAEERFVNVNDNSCEGIEYTDRRAFSVQFNPDPVFSKEEPGMFFGMFIDMMKGGKKNASK